MAYSDDSASRVRWACLPCLKDGFAKASLALRVPLPVLSDLKPLLIEAAPLSLDCALKDLSKQLRFWTVLSH